MRGRPISMSTTTKVRLPCTVWRVLQPSLCALFTECPTAQPTRDPAGAAAPHLCVEPAKASTTHSAGHAGGPDCCCCCCITAGSGLPVAHTAAAALQWSTAWTAVDVAVNLHPADRRSQPLTPLLLSWSGQERTLLKYKTHCKFESSHISHTCRGSGSVHENEWDTAFGHSVPRSSPACSLCSWEKVTFGGI